MGNLKLLPIIAAVLCAVAVTLALLDNDSVTHHPGVWAMVAIAVAVLSLHEREK